MDLERQYSNKSHSHSAANSSCDGYAQKTTERTTLRELLQLPSQNYSVSQIKTSDLDCQEQETLEPKQYKRLGIWKSVKGISWSSIFKPRDTENNKPQRNSKGSAFAKVTKLWKKKQTAQSERKIEPSCCSTWSGNEERQGNLKGNGDLEPHLASPTCRSCDEVCSPRQCGDGAGLLPGGNTVKVDPKTSSGVQFDDEKSCRNLADYNEKQNIEEKQLVEEGDKEGCKTSSFDTQEAEKDVTKESLRIFQHEDPTHLDFGVVKKEMCIEFNDDMLARSSYGGFAEMSASRNASALLSAEFGSPYKLSQSKTWEVFELFDVWTAEEEKLRKQAEAVPKEHKDKGRSWSSLLKPRDREYKQPQRENKHKLVVLPRDNKQDMKPRRNNKVGDLPRDKENKKPERTNKHVWCFRHGNEPVLVDKIQCTPQTT